MILKCFNPGLLGKVTSVPVARVPKLFIDSEQMHKKLQREVKGTLKGEEAEQHLYRLFTEHSGSKNEFLTKVVIFQLVVAFLKDIFDKR